MNDINIEEVLNSTPVEQTFEDVEERLKRLDKEDFRLALLFWFEVKISRLS